jgi:hypothetical protein
LIEGRFFSTEVTQSFSASTGKLNELIQLLHTNQFELKVEFADLKDEGVTFSFYQNAAGPGQARIIINAGKRDLKWSELKIQIPADKENVKPIAAPKTPGPNKPQ